MPEEVPETILKDLLDEVRQLRAEVAENTRITGEIRDGFPGGDPDGHRRYHEDVIEWAAKRKKFWGEMLTHAAKTSFVTAMGGILWALLKALKAGLLIK